MNQILTEPRRSDRELGSGRREKDRNERRKPSVSLGKGTKQVLVYP